MRDLPLTAARLERQGPQGQPDESTQAQTMTWVSGDEVGIYVSTQAANCNTPVFDIDILASEP